jgi:hypoxanthine phosphoribosyltransferase
LNEKEEAVFICILTGSIFFFSDLLRRIKRDVLVDYLKVSSYQGKVSTKNVRILKDLSIDVMDKVVFIVEDIVDTGLTINYIINLLKERKPKEIKVCSLLDKPSQRIVDVDLDFVGFTIPPKFVIGYGLDYNEKYRNKQDILILQEGE